MIHNSFNSYLHKYFKLVIRLVQQSSLFAIRLRRICLLLISRFRIYSVENNTLVYK